MTASRAILYSAITLALSFGIFFLILLFSAKSLYVLYAYLFQLGQVYQGETRSLMYNRYIFTVIAPFSFLFGSTLTWLLITRRWITFVSSTLILIAVLLAAEFLRLEPVASSPASLRDHPSAHWSGGVDGGTFFEITRDEPPLYFVEIRLENGDIWTTGWVSYQDHPLSNSDFWGYDGGDVVYLKNEEPLRLSPDRHAPD